MRKRILIGLLAFSLISILGGLYIVFSLEKASLIHNNLIQLHQVEILREQLLIQIKKVQTDLSLKGTRHARNIDTLVSHVSNMSRVIDKCYNCHHAKDVSDLIDGLRGRAEAYKISLSRVFTVRANTRRLNEVEDLAFKTGEDLIAEVNKMIALTSKILDRRTNAALAQINTSKLILTILLLIGPIVAVGFAYMFYRSFTEPVSTLLEATAKLKKGDLDHRIKGLKYEFGEVAASFDEMAGSLKEQMEKMQRTEQLVLFGEYAAKLAHEIKNPLAGIKVSMEVISQDLDLSEEDRKIMVKVTGEIERINGLLNNLLSFAKPPKPQIMAVNVNAILDKALNFSKKQRPFGSDGRAEVMITKEFGRNIPEAHADPTQLQQVFLNLLLNAVDAMPEGGMLTLRTIYDMDIDAILIDISDTGNGIDDEVKEKIFEPFFTTKPKGTGLGLAISRQLINQNGGSISMEHNEPGGTTFSIFLPLKRVEVDP